MVELNVDEIKLSVPSKPEYVGVIRLTLAAIANRLGFDVEKIEDMKVAVAEACTNAIIHGCHCEKGRNFNIDFISTKEKLTIIVYDDGAGCDTENIEEPDLTKPREGGLGIFIIKSLMDDVEICSNEGNGTLIKMIKYLEDEA